MAVFLCVLCCCTDCAFALGDSAGAAVLLMYGYYKRLREMKAAFSQDHP